jgi:hypothetical protein
MTDADVTDRLHLREALSVPDALRRDELVRRVRQIRDAAVVDRDTILYWNRHHPTEEQFSTAFEDSVIAWCEGRGPLPVLHEGEGAA